MIGSSRTRAYNILSRFPGPATLHQSFLESALFTFLCAAFALILAFAAGGSLWSWIVVAIFVALAVLAGHSLRKGQASRMTLDEYGFTLHEPHGQTRFLWREVSRFDKLDPYRVHSVVIFDDLTREPGVPGVGNASLVENYGLSSLAFMDLMNEWRERALIGVGAGPR